MVLESRDQWPGTSREVLWSGPHSPRIVGTRGCAMTATQVRFILTLLVLGAWLLVLIPFTVAGIMNLGHLGVAVVLTVVALAAIWAPWRRKTKSDPE